MIQRSPVYILSTENGLRRLFEGQGKVYLTQVTSFFLLLIERTGYSEGGLPTHMSDRIRNSFPMAFNLVMMPRMVKAIAEADKFVTMSFPRNH
jgi:hypothetical protein